MAKQSRKIPRNGRPARRPLRNGDTVEGYLLNGMFTPFVLGTYDFCSPAQVDPSVSYDSSDYSGGGSSSYDSGSSSSYDSSDYSGGYDSDYSGGGSSSYDSGSSSSYDSGSY